MIPKRAYALLERIRIFTHQNPLKYRVGVFAVVLLFVFTAFMSAPFGFPRGTIVTVPEGATLTEVVDNLKARSVVHSTTLLRIFVTLMAGDGGVLHGDYFFEEPQTALSVAYRLTHGYFGLTPLSVVLPEGASVAEMAKILAKRFPQFDPEYFILLAKDDEGYLFPDTHKFLPNARAREIYQELRRVFDEKTAPLVEIIEASGHTQHEIVTMASILEEEARTMETRRTIAGILWKRLDIDMLLQVDATFLYINGKNTFQLTLDDLKNNESPYNTYKFKGLPPGPITNPGLGSIKAALTPIETNYIFYLSDLDGNMHYSATFDQHKIKKARYLP